MHYLPFLIPLLALASYESDLKNVNRLGDQADALLSKMGFDSGSKSHLPVSESTEEGRPRELFRVHGDLSVTKISSGQLAFGKLLNRLVVGGEDSPVILELVDSRLGFLRGLRLTGRARQSATSGRVNLEFDRLLLRSRKNVHVDAVGLDPSGALGLTAEVFSSKALMLAGSMAGSFLSGFATGQQTTSTSPFGFSQAQPSGRNALLQGVALTAAEQSKRMIEVATQERPVLVVNPGAEVSVLFQGESSL